MKKPRSAVLRAWVPPHSSRLNGAGLAGGDHAHDVAVLLAKEGDGAGGAGVPEAHDAGHDGLGGKDLRVDKALDAIKLVGGHGLEVGEVKAQAARLDEGAGLGDVLAQDLLEGGVQEVRGGVVAADELAAAVVDGGGDGGADLEGALLDDADVGVQAALALGVGHAQGGAVAADGAGVAALAAHLGVEGRGVKDDLDLGAASAALTTSEPSETMARTLASQDSSS